MDWKSKNLFLLFGLAGFVAVFALGVWTGINQVKCEICPPSDVDFSLFWEAYNTLKEKFVDPEKIDIEKIIYGAISGMTETLEDPYTTFFTPEETKEFEEELSGIYEGIGMEIGIKDNQLQVVAPLEGTPAQKVGLRPGDKIMKVDGEDTSSLSIEEAVTLIRGPRGTKVTLTILREGWVEPKDFDLIRQRIQIPSLKWEIKDDDIAYIRIYQFNEPLSSEFSKAAMEILAGPSKKIILDLRNNPGGYLDIAIDVAGWFLERGKVVVIEDFGGRKEGEKYITEGNSQFTEWPLVVLINEGSASGSEILAGALRYHRDARLVGKPSFGKGSIQEAVELEGESMIKITVAKWLTPDGVSISEVGLRPDVEVEITDEDYEENRDPQLDTAIEILKNTD